MVRHPQELKLHGNVLLGKNDLPYMTTPQICVVNKGKVSEGQDKIINYSFVLNDLADNVWGELFREQVLASKKLSASVHGKAITLSCGEQGLQEKYAVLKEVIEQTNAAYAQEKQRLISTLQGQDIKRQEEQKQNSIRLDQLQKGFNDLKL